MADFLPWIVALPLAGFVLLVTLRRLPARAAAVIGAGSVAAAFALTLWVGVEFLRHAPAGGSSTAALWTWIAQGSFRSGIALRLDGLSLVMMLVVTGVGFLIHLYSVGFMAGEEGYGRFFAYMNLFIASMLILVLADDLLALYLGWEGVGLCSYLLIGFWYRTAANGHAAMKAFLVTRVGDAALAVGLFLIWGHFGTLNIAHIAAGAMAGPPPSQALAIAMAGCLLGGAVGKSAQLPLQVWLPDAMAGPSPVSALIHAATMVTAGVYLIARMHAVFELAPSVLLAVGIIGAATLLLAGFSALVQRDLKRVLAYSTISQIGYMFLALGVGAYGSAIFHFVTHAFFKALLFLAGGAVILALSDEHDMFRMGGLRRAMPACYWTFLAGAASLAALPLVTAGFYSKDAILVAAWSAGAAGKLLCAAGLAGALLTALYTFRMVALVFLGEQRTAPARGIGPTMLLPMILLAGLSVVGGAIDLPPTLGNRPMLSNLLAGVLPPRESTLPAESTLRLQCLAGAISVVGAAAGLWLYTAGASLPARLAGSALGNALRRWWLAGWGFDWLYGRLFVQPVLAAAKANRNDLFDAFFESLGAACTRLWELLRQTQNGRLRWYAATLAIGAIILLAMAVIR